LVLAFVESSLAVMRFWFLRIAQLLFLLGDISWQLRLSILLSSSRMVTWSSSLMVGRWEQLLLSSDTLKIFRALPLDEILVRAVFLVDFFGRLTSSSGHECDDFGRWLSALGGLMPSVDKYASFLVRRKLLDRRTAKGYV
jgi:hypothetical protein